MILARKLKCQWCGEKSIRDEMKQVKKGKVNQYYHALNCYDEYIAEEEFKKKEAIERDSLYNKVMKIYGVKALPTTYFMRIEALRHGNRVFTKQAMSKRYRQGYEYSLIEETYDYSEDSIIWSLNNKAFDNMANALNYGLTIIVNNIYAVEKRKQAKTSREHFEKISENVKEDSENIPDEIGFESSYKKKDTDNNDFFDMLD